MKIVITSFELVFLSVCHPPQTYVRDIYPFRRSVSPQLNLVHMHPEKGQELIQKQVFNHAFVLGHVWGRVIVNPLSALRVCSAIVLLSSDNE